MDTYLHSEPYSDHYKTALKTTSSFWDIDPWENKVPKWKCVITCLWGQTLWGYLDVLQDIWKLMLLEWLQLPDMTWLFFPHWQRYHSWYRPFLKNHLFNLSVNKMMWFISFEGFWGNLTFLEASPPSFCKISHEVSKLISCFMSVWVGVFRCC